MATLDTFVSAPSEELLEQFTEDHLLKLTSYYNFAGSEKRLKECIKEALKAMLIERCVKACAFISFSRKFLKTSSNRCFFEAFVEA